MVSIEGSILARYSSGGKHFEVLVDSDKAQALKAGESVELSELMVVQEVYSDARKAERVTEADLQKVFNTTNPLQVGKEIVLKGEIQLTTDQRRELLDKKKKRISTLIARDAFNPQTGHPHPPNRIEAAMDESKVHIDPLRKAEDQIQKVVEAISKFLPISVEKLRLEVVVPAVHTGKAYGILRNFGIESEQWLDDGSLKVTIKIPAGVEESFYNELNGATQGSFECKKLQK